MSNGPKRSIPSYARWVFMCCANLFVILDIRFHWSCLRRNDGVDRLPIFRHFSTTFCEDDDSVSVVAFRSPDSVLRVLDHHERKGYAEFEEAPRFECFGGPLHLLHWVGSSDHFSVQLRTSLFGNDVDGCSLETFLVSGHIGGVL